MLKNLTARTRRKNGVASVATMPMSSSTLLLVAASVLTVTTLAVSSPTRCMVDGFTPTINRTHPLTRESSSSSSSLSVDKTNTRSRRRSIIRRQKRHGQQRQQISISPLYSTPPDDPFIINVDYNDDDDDDENNDESSNNNNGEEGEGKEEISIAELFEMLQEGLSGDNEKNEDGQVVIQLGGPPPGGFDQQRSMYGAEDEEDDDEDEEDEDPYTTAAASEFTNSDSVSSSSSSIVAANGGDELNTVIDWGGALSKLRERVDDVETGKSQDPSHVLFRQMSSPSPNQLIGQFVSSANPQVVQAMSGAVQSLLGGLSNPNMGIETVVKASGEKIGSLCFQLQMTGYMFRNAEYVLALKDLMNLKGQKLTIEDYREAFDKLDTDGSGFIEMSEVKDLFSQAYDGEKIPPFEVAAFLEFFDENNDGKISWGEFEKGLGAAITTKNNSSNGRKLLEGTLAADDDDDDDEAIDINTNVSGRMKIEMENGRVVDVDAKEYMQNLKQEAKKLKEALKRRRNGAGSNSSSALSSPMNDPAGLLSTNSGGMDIASYIASRQGDVKSLTEGINPEVVETMKLLVDFVLEGGDSGKAKKGLTDQQKAEMEMEIPGAALQQLALWQLVLGYKLREAEAKGEYMRLLDG
eukprot:CAMPEP_0113481884 /NCGR_PEP_ID=MMETSP0014_2-20120614/22636_1 /TAXON_ID=2857 /ORGANISM="Nitzschia sp." /LENGTH=635 /DNA_ID=CAMNT_0000375389 /DNA_START=108 /DNA_END=2015 /DNA_ORIENTATION=+ /assembly_acc=CAM_ASM_000159